ncbi:uncharacterized protein LOC125808249 [Solanum verrucosum]|uniref:uncharacterized protein LOC125808249 n=1 Tax=Solanum verrucosum TaxID=315347 RepID=UPI0020D1ED30|nr:uncharacterized protein LOC125808249 [Solanum verrucosum]
MTFFYKQLLGICAEQLPVVDPKIMSNRYILNREQQLHLISPIAEEKVLLALKYIVDLKTPGYNGFNTLFFKKTWCVVSKEIIEAVLQFFNNNWMYKAINCTVVTLVPKAGFIPGRVITDNILLSDDLVKGYNKKGISPRCMLKFDMQKAYYSVEWHFLEQVLMRVTYICSLLAQSLLKYGKKLSTGLESLGHLQAGIMN